MKDPTLNEMNDFLVLNGFGKEDFTSRLIAMHYFASRHYCGMFSNLYKVICSIDYDQKDLELEDEPGCVVEMFEALETEYS